MIIKTDSDGDSTSSHTSIRDENDANSSRMEPKYNVKQLSILLACACVLVFATQMLTTTTDEWEEAPECKTKKVKIEKKMKQRIEQVSNENETLKKRIEQLSKEVENLTKNQFVADFFNENRALQAYDLSSAKVTLADGFKWENNKAELVVDGKISKRSGYYPYSLTDSCLTSSMNPYITIDMGSVLFVRAVRLFHYFEQGRRYYGSSEHNPRYYGQSVMLSQDGEAWNMVYDTGDSFGPHEPIGGHTVHLDQPVLARFVRHHCGRSDFDHGANFALVQVLI